jgi:hypothetical protein
MNKATKNYIKAIKAYNKAIKVNNRKSRHIDFIRLVDARLRLDVAKSNYEWAIKA